MTDRKEDICKMILAGGGISCRLFISITFMVNVEESALFMLPARWSDAGRIAYLLITNLLFTSVIL